MRNKISRIILYIVIGILVLIWILPVWTTFLTAFKSEQDYISQKFYELPTRFAFIDNLRDIMRIYKMQNHFINSLIYSVAGAGFAIIFASMAAFSIVRMRPKFSFPLFFLIYSGTIFPFQMYLIPLYRMYNKIGLYNTRVGMILFYTAICIPFSLFVFRGFYSTIPKEIEDAAKIDGCSPVRSFISIFLPQSASPTAVVALFQMTWIWNDLLFGMVLSRSENVRPIMVALAQMAGYGGECIPYIMTGVIFTSIPTIMLFILLRKHFISGLSLNVSG